MNDDAIARLDRERYVSLETRRRDGRTVRTPVWLAAHGGRLYVFTEAKAGKVKRLRNFPELRLAPCDLRGKVHGEWIAATGRVVSDPAVVEAAYAALGRKHGWLMTATNFFSRLTGRISGRAMLEIAV